MFCYPHITNQHNLQQSEIEMVQKELPLVYLVNRQRDYHRQQPSEEKSDINTVNLSMLRHLTNQSMIAESHSAALQAARFHPFFPFPPAIHLACFTPGFFLPHSSVLQQSPGAPVAPNFCSWVTRKSQFFHTNHMLGTLDFTGSEHQDPFNFPQSTALISMHIFFPNRRVWSQAMIVNFVLLQGYNYISWQIYIVQTIYLFQYYPCEMELRIPRIFLRIPKNKFLGIPRNS